MLVDFVGRIGKTNVGGKIDDLYFELNKWSFESKFNSFAGGCFFFLFQNKIGGKMVTHGLMGDNIYVSIINK